MEYVAHALSIVWKPESRIAKICRYFICFFLIAYNTFRTLAPSPNTTSIPLDTLKTIIRRMTLASTSLLTILFLVVMLLQKSNILKCFRYGEALYLMRQSLMKTNNTGVKSLFYKFLIKITIDIVLLITSIFLVTVSFLNNRTITLFVNAILFPITILIHFYIATIYYVALALSLICKQTIHESVKSGVNRDVLMLNQMVDTYVKKVHNTFQAILLFFVWDVFIGLVSHVRFLCLLPIKELTLTATFFYTTDYCSLSKNS